MVLWWCVVFEVSWFYNLTNNLIVLVISVTRKSLRKHSKLKIIKNGNKMIGWLEKIESFFLSKFKNTNKVFPQ